MRWKIIIVNAGIVLIVGILSYVLLATSLTEVVANEGQRKKEVAQSLRAATGQLALDALRLERFLAEQASSEAAKKVYSGGTPEARAEAATAQANKIRDAAVDRPEFAKMAPSLVLFVDKQGVAMGRNGTALMRGDKLAEAYPTLAEALKAGKTASDVWLNRQRQEQMLASYAVVRGDEGEVVGALVIGTPLNDERLARTSELTSGHTLAVAIKSGDKLELVASSGSSAAQIAGGVDGNVGQAATTALGTGSVATAPTVDSHVFGASPLDGYGDGKRAVVIAAVPASLVGSMSRLLWPVIGVSALGILLVIVGGVLLGNYIDRPLSEIEEGLLAVINGKTDLRFEIEHAELGGLVFRINSLLNALMGVPEDTTDDQGRPSRPAESPQEFEGS